MSNESLSKQAIGVIPDGKRCITCGGKLDKGKNTECNGCAEASMREVDPVVRKAA